MNFISPRLSACVRASLLLGLVGSLSGCMLDDILRAETAAYAEPTNASLAYLRLMGSRNVKVYPNSTCVSASVPGSGYPAGPQMGGQRKRDVGMRKVEPMPKHYVEIAARAGEPITAAFSFHAEQLLPGVAGTDAPGSRRTSGCYAAASFVPQVGQQYELSTQWSFGRGCALQLHQLVSDGDGHTTRIAIPSQPASGCAVSAPAVDAAAH